MRTGSHKKMYLIVANVNILMRYNHFTLARDETEMIESSRFLSIRHILTCSFLRKCQQFVVNLEILGQK